MVGDVPGHDVSQRPDRERIPTGDARPGPRLLRHVPEKGDRGQANRPELVNQFRPWRVVGMRRGDRHLLIETRQRLLKTACKPESAAEENTLTIVHVVQDFANSPFAGRVTVKTFLLRYGFQKLERISHL